MGNTNFGVNDKLTEWTQFWAMSGTNDFIQKAKDAEALAASTQNLLLKMTLRILAQEYRVLAEQENSAPVPSIQPLATVKQ